LGKGLTFCPKVKSHDKIKLAEETFRYTRRLRLKEFFHKDTEQTTFSGLDNEDYSQKPFFNKKASSFTPKCGRDQYLDMYIEAVTQDIINSTK